MAKQPKQLYHFTCRLWLDHGIRTEGLVGGYCPVGEGREIDCPTLTTDPDPGHQKTWTLPPELVVLDKTAVRITVRPRHRDPRLIRWTDLARQHRAEPEYLRAICAKGEARDWWAYLGPIRPEMFREVEVVDPALFPSERELIAFFDEHGLRTRGDYRRMKPSLRLPEFEGVMLRREDYLRGIREEVLRTGVPRNVIIPPAYPI